MPQQRLHQNARPLLKKERVILDPKNFIALLCLITSISNICTTNRSSKTRNRKLRIFPVIIDENIQHYLECNDCGGPAIVVILRSTNGYPILRSWSFCLTSCHIIAKFSTPRRTNLLMFNHTLFLKSLTFLTSILAATDLFWLKTMNLKFESRNEIGEIVLIQKILPKTFSTIRSSSRTTAATTAHHKYGTRSKAWWKRGTCSVPRFDQGEHDFGHRFGLGGPSKLQSNAGDHPKPEPAQKNAAALSNEHKMIWRTQQL